MATMKLIEALGRKKVLASRIDSERKFIENYALLPENQKDPLEKSGGSPEMLRRAFQAIADLEENIIKTNAVIHEANSRNMLKINNIERSVADWINWKEKVAKGRIAFLEKVLSMAIRSRNSATQQQVRGGTNTQTTEPIKILVQFDEAGLTEELKNLKDLYEIVDTKLSLVNASIDVEVPD